MPISMYTTYLNCTGFSSFEEGLKAMYSQGIRLADMVDGEFSERPLVLYIEQLAAAHIKPNALVTTLDIALEEEKLLCRNIAIIKGYIDQMERYGIPYLMPAPRVRPARNTEQFYAMRERLIESLLKISEYAKGSGVNICIENQSESHRADSRTEDVRYILMLCHRWDLCWIRETFIVLVRMSFNLMKN